MIVVRGATVRDEDRMKYTLPVLAFIVAMILATGCGTNPSNPVAVSTPAPTATSTAIPTPTATDRPPVLNLRLKPDPPTGAAPFTLLAKFCDDSDPDGDAMSADITWGDGHHVEHSSGCRYEHVYAAPGNYHASFCADDHIAAPVCQDHVIVVS
jgi:PKD domain